MIKLHDLSSHSANMAKYDKLLLLNEGDTTDSDTSLNYGSIDPAASSSQGWRDTTVAPPTGSLSTEQDEANEYNKKTAGATASFVYVLTFFSTIGGFLFGYDTGVVSGALILIRDDFALTVLWQELFVSITIGTAAIFAFLAGTFNEVLGRKPVIIISSFVFTTGAVVLGVAIDKWMLLAGRAILGIGIGFASMTVPIYIAECAPLHLRGRLIVLNNLFITGGQFTASVVDGLFSNVNGGWRYMLGLAGVPSLIQFIGFIFMPESPRWLIGKNRLEEATIILKRIRAQSDVDEEVESIRVAVLQDAQAHTQGGSTFVRAFKTATVRRALFVGCMLQVFQQISGINTVMYYSASIIKMSGVKDNSTAIWLAAMTASINFVFTLVGLYLVDRIGRRPLTLGSLAGTTASLAVLAIAFQLAAIQSPHIAYNQLVPNNTDTFNCLSYTMCDACVLDENCGFCFSHVHDEINGSCVAAARSHHSPDPSAAGYGECKSEPAVGGWTWAYEYCPTNIAWMALLGLILYLVFFAPGMGPMPWTINSEIYPLWARSFGMSVATATNWTFNLLISMTFLTLTQTITRYGAFWLYTCFAFIGCIFVYIFVPETKGKPLEEVEQLFTKPLCSRISQQ